MIKSSMPITVVVVLLFMLAKEPAPPGQPQVYLTWDQINSRIHWGAILLICGGMSLAGASKVCSLIPRPKMPFERVTFI